MSNESYPIHKELFEVVMLKKGVGAGDATPADFKRVPVTAENPLAAQIDDGVMADKEYDALFATRPGVLTGPETEAYRRQAEGSVPDRTKI